MFELSSLLSFPLAMVIVFPVEIMASFIANFVILKKTDVNQMRIATRDYNAFMKEYRQAISQKDQARVDKLKKKMKSVQDPYTKAQRERLRITFSYLLPLSGLYYLLGFLIGFSSIIAVSPYEFNLLIVSASHVSLVNLFQKLGIQSSVLLSIPYAGGMSLFTWYFLTYTGVNLLMSRAMGTSFTT
jgi:uncharacterized membrane protein (DUF106 family)